MEDRRLLDATVDTAVFTAGGDGGGYPARKNGTVLDCRHQSARTKMGATEITPRGVWAVVWSRETRLMRSRSSPSQDYTARGDAGRDHLDHLQHRVVPGDNVPHHAWRWHVK